GERRPDALDRRRHFLMRRAGRPAVGHLLLDDETTRGQVVRAYQRYEMRMGMRDIGAEKGEADAFDPVDVLQRPRDLLAGKGDFGEQLGRRLLEGNMMFLRDNLSMAGPDRSDVEKSDQPFGFIYDMGGKSSRGDAAERAFG